MAQIDTSIYGPLLQQPKSLIGYSNELDQADVNRAQAQSAKLNLIGQQQDYQDQQKLRQLYAQPGFDPNSKDSLPSIFAVSPKAGMAAQKAQLDAQQVQADIAHKNAQAGQAAQATAASQFEVGRKKLETAMQIVTTANDPASAHAGFQQAVRQGLMTPEEAAQKEQEVPSDPQGFQQWRQSSALALLSAKDRFDLAEKQQKQAEDARHNRADEGIQVRGQNMTRDTAAANREAENLRAGFGPAGSDDANFERTAQAVARGDLPAPTGMALLNPKNQRMLGRVMEINPQYDFTSVTAKKAAATGFTSGQQGNQMRSFATGGQHLDQLGTLIDALNNGDNKTLNQIGNAIQTWSGSSEAPSDFNAAKDIVAKEVMKAIVAGGGGQSEREELAKSLSDAKSPKLLKGVVRQYRNLMTAQYENLLEQRRAAGLPDSTLPDYSKPDKPTASGGWKVEEVK